MFSSIVDIIIGLAIIVFIISILAILRLREGYGILKTLSPDPFTGTTLLLIAVLLSILGLIVIGFGIVSIVPIIVKHLISYSNISSPFY